MTKKLLSSWCPDAPWRSFAYGYCDLVAVILPPYDRLYVIIFNTIKAVYIYTYTDSHP